MTTQRVPRRCRKQLARAAAVAPFLIACICLSEALSGMWPQRFMLPPDMWSQDVVKLTSDLTL